MLSALAATTVLEAVSRAVAMQQLLTGAGHGSGKFEAGTCRHCQAFQELSYMIVECSDEGITAVGNAWCTAFAGRADMSLSYSFTATLLQ